MPALDAVTQATSLLEEWASHNSADEDVIETLTKLCDLIEAEITAWLKTDPDPFDDRHPGRSDPDCSLGHVLKAMLKNDTFMNKLLNSYLTSNRESRELHIVCCRLLLNIMPGLETSVVYGENEPLVRQLVEWTENAEDPLWSYAVGLLAGAMEVQENITTYKDHNAALVPRCLKRLHELKSEAEKERSSSSLSVLTPGFLKRPFANIGKESESPECKRFAAAVGENSGDSNEATSSSTNSTTSDTPRTNKHSKRKKRNSKEVSENSHFLNNSAVDIQTKSSNKASGKLGPWRKVSPVKVCVGTVDECSGSSWIDQEQRYIIGTYSMWPLSIDMKQRLLLQYLSPMGEYQELLSAVFKHKAMELIFYYIDIDQQHDIMLAFKALGYLATLLCHKKFAVAFISVGGVQRLLKVHRPSMAATGISLCLYYLAYFQDTMERVCLLPHPVLKEMVQYVFWLLECSHESGRCHAIMFFSMAFSFRFMLELFDEQDGLRRLFNVMSTLSILDVETDVSLTISEDDMFTARQAARHVCVALKSYLEAHLAVKADQMRRSHLRQEGGSLLAETPAYKASTFPREVIEDNLMLLLECLPYNVSWEPVSHLVRMDGVQLLLQLIAMAAEWSSYSGRAETIRCALEVLHICSVMPSCLMLLCASIPLPDNVKTPAISVLLGLAEGEILADSEIQISALNVIINCVCAPLSRMSGSSVRVVGSYIRRRSMFSGEELLNKMWYTLRTHNGIMVLLKLLMVKTPIIEADAIRGLACKALVGLARCPTVRQIMGKLPLFEDGTLQMLMREPVLQDKRQEHVTFCKYATELLEMVAGKPRRAEVTMTLDVIRRADVVAATKITYHQKELLHLIHEHLLSRGLTESATILQKEAELPAPASPPTAHPAAAQIYSTPSSSLPADRQLVRHQGEASSACVDGPGQSRPNTASDSPRLPIKVNMISSKTSSSSNHMRLQQTKRILRQKNDMASHAGSPVCGTRNKYRLEQKSEQSAVTLDKIVTEYLRQQHSVCTDPMRTCPPFSLLTPHRCPAPRHRGCAPINFTSRMFRRAITPRYGGPDGLKCDRKYVYSRFRPIRNYRDSEENGCFSCCNFSADEKNLLLGTYVGDLKCYDVLSGEELGTYYCHQSPITNCQPSRDGNLVLTSSSWSPPLSALWKTGPVFSLKTNFDEDSYVEFSKQTQDRVIGTKEETANIYDVATGQKILTLFDPNFANNYTRNRATFNPTDDLVLNDGVLWDVLSGKPVHKFDKFNPNVSGVFHPSGLEVVINMEVWDIRTYHLLHTVPALNQCQIRFNKNGDVIYGAMLQFDDEEDTQNQSIKSPFGSSFRTFDGQDYSNIATVDVKKNIFDLCTDSTDAYLAVIENHRSEEALSEESICRLYQVGRRKDSEDDQGEEDDVDEDEEGDDDDDDDDDEDDDDDDDDDGSQSEEEFGQDDGHSDSDHANSDSEDEDANLLDISEQDMSDDDDDDDIDDADYDDDDDDMYFELSDLSNM